MNIYRRRSNVAARVCVAASFVLAAVTIIIEARWAGTCMLTGLAVVSVFLLIGKQRVHVPVRAGGWWDR